MTPIREGLLRRPTTEEVEKVARITHEAVLAHRRQIMENWPHATTLQGHSQQHILPWAECEEATREQARRAVWDLIDDADGLWRSAYVPVAYITCGCTPIAMVTLRIALVELGVLPLWIPREETGVRGLAAHPKTGRKN